MCNSKKDNASFLFLFTQRTDLCVCRNNCKWFCATSAMCLAFFEGSNMIFAEYEYELSVYCHCCVITHLDLHHFLLPFFFYEFDRKIYLLLLLINVRPILYIHILPQHILYTNMSIIQRGLLWTSDDEITSKSFRWKPIAFKTVAAAEIYEWHSISLDEKKTTVRNTTTATVKTTTT